MSLKKGSLLAIVILLPIAFFLEKERRLQAALSVPIYTYHNILPSSAYTSANLHLDPNTFETHLQSHQDQGFETISFADLVAYTKFQRLTLPKKPLIITLDDTWSGQYEYAFPLLQKYNFTATFFINSGWVESGSEFMTWDEIRSLHASGMEIGGHTVNHVELTGDLPAAIIQSEIITDKQKIEAEIGEPISTFAYPFNTHNSTVMEYLKTIGYQSARTGAKTDLSGNLYNLTSQIRQ